MSNLIIKECEEAKPTIYSGDTHTVSKFPASHVLTRQLVEEYGKNYWLPPHRRTGQFILNLGCVKTINTIELVNTHNDGVRDYSTKGFQVYIR